MATCFRSLVGLSCALSMASATAFSTMGDPPPVNDACSSAVVVGLGTTGFSNIGATNDGPPDCGLFGADIWYRYTASFTGNLLISLCNSNYDSRIAVYANACTCPATNQVACEDDTCGLSGLSPEVTIPVSAGACYLIRVGGFDSAMGLGTMTLARVGSGDECTDSIPVGNGSYAATTANNTGAIDDSSCAFNDVIDEWFSYIAPYTGVAKASTCNAPTSFDTTLTVFDGCGGAELRCDDDDNNVDDGTICVFSSTRTTVRWPVTAGQVYMVRVAGWNGSNGGYQLDLSCNPCPSDFNTSGATDVTDLLQILGSWGPCEDCAADINGDEFVDVVDLLYLLGHWGGC